VTVTHFPVLEVLFGLVQSHGSTTHLLLQDLVLLLQRHDNCHAFKRLAGWHVHLLSLLFDGTYRITLFGNHALTTLDYSGQRYI